MKEVAVIGIGGAGGTIVDFINRTFSPDCSLLIIDSDRTRTSSSVPIQFYSEESTNDMPTFSSFLSESLPSNAGHIVLVSGFTGKNSSLILESAIGYAHSQKKGITITGVTPFSFEGKKLKEAEALISALGEITDNIVSFSNSSLLQSIDPSTPLEQAVESNYHRIFEEVIKPLIPEKREVSETVYQAEAFIFHTPWYRRKSVRITAAISGFLTGIAATLAAYFLITTQVY